MYCVEDRSNGIVEILDQCCVLLDQFIVVYNIKNIEIAFLPLPAHLKLKNVTFRNVTNMNI